MPERPVDILVVEPDADLAEMIVRQLETSVWSRVTTAGSVAEGMAEELTSAHDLVLTCLTLPDGDGLDLIREVRAENDCPILLLAEDISADQAVEALRLGVVDVLQKPFDLTQLCTLVRQVTRKEIKRRKEQARYKRLRRIASKIIHERQDTHQRMDLICRDVVHAYRQLAEKVTASHELTHDTDF